VFVLQFGGGLARLLLYDFGVVGFVLCRWGFINLKPGSARAFRLKKKGTCLHDTLFLLISKGGVSSPERKTSAMTNV
jgi:hypothetical protein